MQKNNTEKGNTMDNSFFSSMDTQPHAFLFAGQSTPWTSTVDEAAQNSRLLEQLRAYDAAAEALLQPAATELLTVYGRRLDLFSYASQSLILGDARYAEVSVPGVVLAQLAALLDSKELGMPFASGSFVRAAGHSQGLLSTDIVDVLSRLARGEISQAGADAQITSILAVSRLIGAAGSRIAGAQGIVPVKDASPMLSVKGATREQIEVLISRIPERRGEIVIGVKNSRDNYVVSGYPEDLRKLETCINNEHKHQQKLREQKVRGGSVFDPSVEYLEVSIPFHSPVLADAVELVGRWADECGIDGGYARRLARAVLVDTVDWAAQIEGILSDYRAWKEAPANGEDTDSGSADEPAAGSEGSQRDGQTLWFIDYGPGVVAEKLTAALIEGTGAGVVSAASAGKRLDLATPGRTYKPAEDWSQFAPHIVSTEAGDKVSTAFTRLTGRSPIMVAGMTPTTVEPDLPAAAANAGYWAELAGGGQVTEEVFDNNIARLKSLLDEGTSVEFNAMFMDRYLWNLQFGGKRIVSKARISGAPVDGVVISAGIPEADEAMELITQLHDDGFTYIVFKPGTVAQIRQVLDIAKEADPVTVIMEVEGGAAGGHHSWESLDDLLVSTYADIRARHNVVLVAGGGIGTPERAADYISGQWSEQYGLPAMPVDGVLVGTALMTAKEAHTSPQVKKFLVETPGITDTEKNGDPFAPLGESWVPSGGVAGGMSSGLSHLHADIYEIENASARAGRLIVHLEKHPEELESRRDEIIKALDSTAKPYFGDVEDMTYYEWAERFVELTYPWADRTFGLRFLHLLHRIEARINEQDKGTFTSVFSDAQAVEDPQQALEILLREYPESHTAHVAATDAAWFPQLSQEYPKPLPFVPVIDGDLLRWWGRDQLWQAEDSRYSADSVRIIPGPLSVAGITTMNEPVVDILSRFDKAVADRVRAADSKEGYRTPASLSAQEGCDDDEAFIRQSPTISWVGHVMDNPAYNTRRDDPHYTLTHVRTQGMQEFYDLDIHLDTFWDGERRHGAGEQEPYAVRHIVIPLIVDHGHPFRMPVVDRDRLKGHIYTLLTGTAGIGNTAVTGDVLDRMPEISPETKDAAHPFGIAAAHYTLSANLGYDHESATAGHLPQSLIPSGIVPDALTGPAWPAIYTALGSVYVGETPIIEGLLNAVHLDHSVELLVSDAQLQGHYGQRIDLKSWAEDFQESSAGRVVTIHVEHAGQDGTVLAHETERFAIRGRVYSSQLPEDAPDYGGIKADIRPAARRLLRRVTVQAPDNMTAFARVSGDFNPIHTSARAARVSGLQAPLVHGMWLSAAAQHVVQAADTKGAHYEIAGWTYAMYGMVQLNDRVEISVERVGKVNDGGIVIEVTCRIGEETVSRATAVCRPYTSAYVFPGQGIQKQGMTLDERAQSPAARQVWERADRLTRSRLGFSILAVVRDNPKELTARGVTYRHPEGLLNLTQFTQVALATVAQAQTARLREAGMIFEPAYFAGHSLGEYNALSAFAQIIPLETELELVFHRGSTMHHLIERDAQGRSNYRMGALRPNQFGVDDAHVNGYIDDISRQSGEFLQIVNYNLAGSQYAIAGTIAGLKALEKDSSRRAREAGGKKPFMLVPGIDVPFHSTLLRKGVPEFRAKLDSLLPEDIKYRRLVGRYIPNLVARPFELTRDFARAILDVVPSEQLRAIADNDDRWNEYAADEGKLARLLLIELLCWQFASPVRWIETQSLLFTPEGRGGLGVENYVEVGLGNSPTLANLGSRTLLLPEFAGVTVDVFNAGRDEKRVYMTDDDPDSLVEQTEPEADTEPGVSEAASAGEAASPATAPAAGQGAAEPAKTADTNTALAGSAGASGVAGSAGTVPASGAAPAEDIPFTAWDGIRTLIAYSAKIRPDQIGVQDTTDTLTNGVSSRRNQLLMDMSAELGVPSIEGAAEAAVSALEPTITKAAPRYKAFGHVLSDAVRERIHQLFGSAGVKQSHIAQHVHDAWGLGDGWAAFVTAELLLGTREGASTRGGDLATLPAGAVSNTSGADALIDKAVQAVAAAHGVTVAPQSAQSAGAGAMVDSAALKEFSEQITGESGILASAAHFILDKLGIKASGPAEETEDNSGIVDMVNAELGPQWPKLVSPRFDARKAVLLDDRWASAREDLAHIYYGDDEQCAAESYTGAGEAVARQAAWYAQQARLHGGEAARHAETFGRISREALRTVSSAQEDAGTLPFARDIAVVTGASEKSIAGQVAAQLLAGGATVIATSYSFDTGFIQWAKEIYRTHAAGEARLWIVPANLSSYRDVDALAAWVGNEQKETHGATTTVVKPAYAPTLLFPFAAPGVHGTLSDSGELFESQARLMLWGVERLISRLGVLGADTDVDHRLHVVLPGSPNRGTLGGDGAYGEVKSAFDAIVNRSRVEKDWSGTVTFAHPRIGWVRGTGLMGGNDPLVEAIERRGVRTYSTEEIAAELLKLSSAEAREQAEQDPVEADLTGGMGSLDIDMSQLREEALAGSGNGPETDSSGEHSDAGTVPENVSGASLEAGDTPGSPAGIAPDPSAKAGASAEAASENTRKDTSEVKALPTLHTPQQPEVRMGEWDSVTARPEDEVVIVSIGELGTWGSGRTRRDAELGIAADGTVDLSAEGVLELAWNMGLISWQDSPEPGWIDADGNLIAEEDIYEKFHDDVVARSGIRPFDDGMGSDYLHGTDSKSAEVFLDHDVTFSVANEAAAREYMDADSEHTVIRHDDGSDEWLVTRTQGASAFVPRRAVMTRTVGGQFPKGFDPRKWGIPASMVDSVDPIALWNIVTTVDAFISAGFSPSEILQSIHPSMLASTQGTGFGGMNSMRQLYVNRYLSQAYPTDILQEALPNVVAAHVMQSYVGGYGNMIQPVSACATAAVSLEEGVDKIKLGKSDFVVTGAIDDIGVESVNGFGDMNATANSEEMYGKGIDSRFFSRANDRRRGGFLEAQGGGTILITRGDLAMKLGLPVAAVVGYANSFADGAHTSIPAPGLGALAAARGGRDSALVRQLAALGIAPDDIAVVSKHDTSTNANDPNESELHNTLAHAIGRSEGNPLYVISQKTLTGHAKGGAAIFQINGLVQVFASGIIPANASLDCVDPKLAGDDLMVWLRRPLDLGKAHHTIKAGLVTSLGFGHVSGFIALVHPGAFEAAVEHAYGQDVLRTWKGRANKRLAEGGRHRRDGMIGRKPLFELIDNRRFHEDSRHYDSHEAEKAMLLDPQARLADNGYYEFRNAQ